MSRNKRSSFTNNSPLQQNFIVENAFKRNKRYLNFSKIKQAQHQFEANRRRPFSSSQKSVDQKINSSFMNTTAAFSDKVQSDIGRFKLRMSCVSGNENYSLTQSHKSLRSFTPDSQRNQRSVSAKSLDKQPYIKKKIHGMALDKYCSRQQYYQSKNHPVVDQRLFNNYSENKSDQIHTKDFQKYISHNLDFSLKNVHDIQYNTQQLYGEYYYKKTTMQCNFNYKTQKKTPRQIYVPKRKQDIPATELSPQKVKQSEDKCTMLRVKNIQCFYSNTGRQLPCQLDMRNNTNLTNYWVDNRGKVITKPKQYSLRKMKDDLVEAKLEKIQNNKHPKFDRNDLCDQKYFRVHSKI